MHVEKRYRRPPSLISLPLWYKNELQSEVQEGSRLVRAFSHKSLVSIRDSTEHQVNDSRSNEEGVTLNQQSTKYSLMASSQC